jgi:signal transduction histidine kinase/ActR/RegA family two-component response regulator
VRAKGLIVVAVPLIALIATTSASLALQYSERRENNAAVAASGLSSAAGLVLADAVNAESGVRGYAATGRPLFLAPYQLALTRIGAERAALQDAAITEGDARQQRVVDATTGRVLVELVQLRSAVTAGIPARVLLVRMRDTKTSMDLLRRQVADLNAGPAASLTRQRSQITMLETAIDRLNVAGLVLGLLAGLAGVALFTSGISRRVVAAAANADRLGQGLPLEPVAPSGDDLGRLAGSLVRAQQLLASREAQLTAARDEALSATQVKNSFLSHTSHELRTPLNSILGFTQLLGMSDLSDEDHDSAARILGAGRHLLALINELIDIARIESGDLSLSVEPVSILPLVEEASNLLSPLAAERSIVIASHCTNPALAAHADRQRFAQVLVNLISNAVKYNRHGGAITITCQEGGTGQASVVISDTGRGMREEDLERIFAPFERLDAGQTEIEGTGIGLPLAKALTEAMGGQLTASTVLGEGSAFTVSLPRAPDVIHVPPRDTKPASPARPFAPAGATINVLYIEDNPANVEVVSRFLKGRGNARLHSVASGRAGLDSAMRDIPDIILLDLHLPDLPGDHVLRELKAEPSTAAIPVVVLSADATQGVVRRLLSVGALAYLTKPLDLAELGELLDSSATPAQDHTRTATLATPA